MAKQNKNSSGLAERTIDVTVCLAFTLKTHRHMTSDDSIVSGGEKDAWGSRVFNVSSAFKQKKCLCTFKVNTKVKKN